MNRIKVLIIDDSRLMQELLTEILSKDEAIQVVGVASDAFIARDLIKELNPDVLTLDIMMPGMDGITFLKNVMRLHPMPVIMISSLTKSGSEMGVEALANGAIDYLEKPSTYDLQNPDKYTKKLIDTIKIAANANLESSFKNKIFTGLDVEKQTELLCSSELLNKTMIVIGASTGGVEAIEFILSQLPKIFPPILITLHIRREFSQIYLRRLACKSRLIIKPAKNMEAIKPGHVYFAIPEYHLTIGEINSCYYTLLTQSPPVNSHIPSVDVLFSAVAKIPGIYTIGILLTGMGIDGAQGLKRIKETGGAAIVEDESTSVVWGMPGAAVKLGAVDFIVPLPQIPKKLLSILDLKNQSLRR